MLEINILCEDLEQIQNNKQRGSNTCLFCESREGIFEVMEHGIL